MMSEFKFCPMCGVERQKGEEFCRSCDFEYLTGTYVKIEDDSEEKIDVRLVSQEEFTEANDLIKTMDAEINESIDKCLNKIAFDLENDSRLMNLNSGFDSYVLSSADLNVSSALDDLADADFSHIVDEIDCGNEKFLKAQKTFTDWIVYNQSHLPGFIINKYKEPAAANISRLNLIIESLKAIEGYDGLDGFLDVLNDYLDNQEGFLNNF